MRGLSEDRWGWSVGTLRPPAESGQVVVRGMNCPEGGPLRFFDLNAALVLVRLVQTGGFRGAARALAMTKTTVSRKVSELEEQLGVQLFSA